MAQAQASVSNPNLAFRQTLRAQQTERSSKACAGQDPCVHEEGSSDEDREAGVEDLLLDEHHMQKQFEESKEQASHAHNGSHGPTKAEVEGAVDLRWTRDASA